MRRYSYSKDDREIKVLFEGAKKSLTEEKAALVLEVMSRYGELTYDRTENNVRIVVLKTFDTNFILFSSPKKDFDFMVIMVLDELDDKKIFETLDEVHEFGGDFFADKIS